MRLAREVVELRVHGVSGASAQVLLDHPVVVRVAGDDRAGFYRPRPGFGTSERPEGLHMEAYRWGALTAGATVRTLSLLFLLPFMLSNLAVWARPATGGHGGAIGALCRLLAATLTAAFVLSVVGATVDLIGWQCVPYRPCTEGRGFLAWLDALPLWPRLALLALLPLGALRLVWWLGARSARTFEAFPAAPGREQVGGGEDRIDRPGFWDDELVVRRLRAIDVAIGQGVLNLSLLVALVKSDRTPIGVVLLAATGILLAAGVLLLSRPARSGPAGPHRRPVNLRGIPTLRVVGAGLTVLTLGYIAVPREPEPVGGLLPGFAGTVAILVGVQAVLLAALVGTTMQQRRKSPPTATSWWAGWPPRSSPP